MSIKSYRREQITRQGLPTLLPNQHQVIDSKVSSSRPLASRKFTIRDQDEEDIQQDDNNDGRQLVGNNRQRVNQAAMTNIYV